jgi:23S rRNA (uracil1939-C5)-methyltransferase
MTRASGQYTTKGKGKGASNSAAKGKAKTRVGARKGAAKPAGKGKKPSPGQPKQSQKPSSKARGAGQGTTRGTGRPDARGTARDTARGAARSAAKGAAKQAARAESRGQAKVGAEIELFIESLAAGGEGVGRDAGGRVTFVPYTAPGDAIKARLVEAHKDYARGEPLQIMVSSTFRVDAPCPHFVARTCGGCQWQHLGEAVQASAKDELAARVLRKHVSAGMELHPLRAEVQPYYWRRRARLHWYRPRKAAAATLGFYAPRSHLVADIPGCVQLEPVLKQAVDILRAELAPALGRQGAIEVLASAPYPGHPGEVHVFIHGSAGAEAAAALVGRGPITGVMLDADADELPPRRPAPGGAGGPAGGPGDKPPRRARKRAPQSWGKPVIELEPGLPGRADWFAQPSHAGNRVLLEIVGEAAASRAGQRVLELYAGSGNLSRILAPGAAAFVAVDHRKPPWKMPAGLDDSFLAGDVAEVTARLADEGQRFDLVVLDPPRTGAREIIDAIAALEPARIVYVSCDLATLARDLDLLVAAGYQPRWAKPLDLMPQTAHIEVVTLLERRAPGQPG